MGKPYRSSVSDMEIEPSSTELGDLPECWTEAIQTQMGKPYRSPDRSSVSDVEIEPSRTKLGDLPECWIEAIPDKSSVSDVEIAPSRTELGDLPECCIASILSRTTPKDLARLACVNNIFRAASSSDLVWQRMLPPEYLHILALALDAPASTRPKKEIYYFLTKRVVLKNGTQDFWLDRATGGVCRSIGARGLYIEGGNEPRYWRWTKREGSRFDEVANLLRVTHLEIRGNLQCGFLPSGTYTLAWRLSFSFGMTDFQGFKDTPLKFAFQSTGNEVVHFDNVLTSSSRIPSDLRGQLQPLWRRGDGEQWMEIDVGEFTVERGDLPVELSFSMKQTTSFWKSGMFLDCVFIRPKSLRVKEKVQRFKRAFLGKSRGRADSMSTDALEGRTLEF